MGVYEYVAEGEGTSIPEILGGDYDGMSNVISLSEVLRFIQFYNPGSYYRCDDPLSDEGYCPGASTE